MKRLGTRVNLIPVIAKADTLTQNDLFVFKQRVRVFSYVRSSIAGFLNFSSVRVQIREVIVAQGIRIYQPPVDTDDEAAAEHENHSHIHPSSSAKKIPLAIEATESSRGRVMKFVIELGIFGIVEKPARSRGGSSSCGSVGSTGGVLTRRQRFLSDVVRVAGL